MRRRVYHFRSTDNPGMTMCNREATYRYRFTDNPETVTCARCRARLVRVGTLTPTVEDVTASAANTSTSVDRIMDAWMLRCGIVN